MAKNIPAEVEALIRPVIESTGISLWNVELEKENGGLNLLVTIDKEDGITINDCADITRLIDPMLDEADPIPTSYCLEVSSVGTERVLKRKEHYDYAIRTALPCNVKLFAPLDGVKEFVAVVKAYDDAGFTFDVNGEEKIFAKKSIAKLYILHQID